ncbi:MAG: LPS export ABC transporter periplasmic protein LptC [Elusimicrobia bacterium RIFOXYD2_FULL_34_30]|nr:MAG: LPS export ABC transporter periplasmic protein LptC [Elusimicrobia bacterium RIFOXYD2_FULL_34_30]
MMFFIFASCNKKTNKFFVNDTFPEQVIKNLSIDKYDLNKHEWNFFAVHGNVFEKKKIVNATDIKMSFYEEGKTSSFIMAENAVLNSETGDIKAKGNVIIVSLFKGTTLYTDLLNYAAKTNRITSSSYVRQESDDTTITGMGFTANSDLSDITILKDVKVVKKL